MNTGFAVANIPLFTIGKFEIYRLILCNIVCEGLLSLIFAYFSFNDMGKVSFVLNCASLKNAILKRIFNIF